MINRGVAIYKEDIEIDQDINVHELYNTVTPPNSDGKVRTPHMMNAAAALFKNEA